MENESYPVQNEATEEISSRIDLRFFRHDEKESDKTKHDNDIELTPKGRMHAKEQAGVGDISHSVAFGSPRKRAQETAGFVMAGNVEGVTGEENFKDLEAKINEGIGYGSKINVDERLNFRLEEDTPYGKAAYEAYNGKTLMSFLIEKSDAMAEEYGDTKNDTYSRQAAGIAEIVLKYVGIAPRFDQLAHEKNDEGEPVMRRFFGTHQSVAESFLLKIVEATQGTQDAVELARSLGNGSGFSEGFEAEVVTREGQVEPELVIHAPRFGIDGPISLDLVRDIAGKEEVAA